MGNIAQWGESLTQQRRVREEGLRIVNLCPWGRKQMTVPKEEATANYVPAAAVIRRWQALSGFTGRKGSAGGIAKLDVKSMGSTRGTALETVCLECRRGKRNS